MCAALAGECAIEPSCHTELLSGDRDNARFVILLSGRYIRISLSLTIWINAVLSPCWSEIGCCFRCSDGGFL